MSTKSKTEKTKLPSASVSDLVEEDGWLFRERPGIPVECVRRATGDLQGEPRPLYQSRQNYPNT